MGTRGGGRLSIYTYGSGDRRRDRVPSSMGGAFLTGEVVEEKVGEEGKGEQVLVAWIGSWRVEQEEQVMTNTPLP